VVLRMQPTALFRIPVMMVHSPCALPKQGQEPLLPCFRPIQSKPKDAGMWPHHPAPPPMAAAPVAAVISETSHLGRENPTLSLVESSSVSSKPCPVPFVSMDRFSDRFGERTAIFTIILLNPSLGSPFPSPLHPHCQTVDHTKKVTPLSKEVDSRAVIRSQKDVSSFCCWFVGSALKIEGHSALAPAAPCLSGARKHWQVLDCVFAQGEVHFGQQGAAAKRRTRIVAPGLNAMPHRRFQLITQLKEMKENFGSLEAESNPFLTMLGA
jgi:hypothetical protein